MAEWIDTTDLPFGLGKDAYLAPRAVVQGAVFSSLVFKGRTVRPVYTKPTMVAEYGHVKVWQTTGEQLDQGDADVYLELARMAVEQLNPASQLVEVNVNADAFLKRVGRERGTESRKWLASCISRLKRASFMFEVPGLKEWETSLLWDFERNFETKVASEYVIQMNPKIVKVYAAGKTLIKASERMALNQDTLAKSLHSFFSSHDKHGESKVSVERLMALTGRTSMRKDRFVAGLKESIEHLKAVTNWTITFSNDMMTVRQAGTKKASVPAKPAAPRKPASAAPAPAAAKPAAAEAPQTFGWDNVTGMHDLEALELGRLIMLMDDTSRKLYDATKPKDALDMRGKKVAALNSLEEQLYMTLDKRAYEAKRGTVTAWDDDI